MVKHEAIPAQVTQEDDDHLLTEVKAAPTTP